MKESKYQVSAIAPQSGAPALKFDPREYSHFLADTGWTEAQKDEFTEALWLIIVSFADRGFNLNPVQLAASEKALEVDSPSVVGCGDNSKANKEKDVERGDVLAAQGIDS